MKRLAPPGRKASSRKVQSFKADTELADEIAGISIEEQAEKTRQLEEQKKKEKEELERKQKEEEERLQRENDEKLRKEEEARQLKLKKEQEEREEEERKLLALKKKREEEEQKLKLEQEKLRKAEEERQLKLQQEREEEDKKRHLEKARRQEETKRREEALKAQREELKRQEEELEKQKLALEEQKKLDLEQRKKEEEERELQRKQEQDLQAKQREEELKRLEEEEKEAERLKERLELEKKRFQEEQKRLEIEKQQRIQEQKVKEENELKFKKEAELQAKLEAEERKAKELAKKAEEEEKEQEERELKRLEEERLNAQKELEEAANAKALAEEAELAEQKRKAEENRQKRALFLSDMDSFSNDFSSKTKEEEEILKQKNAKLDQHISEQEKKRDEITKKQNQEPAKDKESLTLAPIAGLNAGDLSIPDDSSVMNNSKKTEERTVESDDLFLTNGKKDSNKNLNDLSSSLFGSKPSLFAEDSQEPSQEAAAESSSEKDSNLPEPPTNSSASTEPLVLRVPTRIGKEKTPRSGSTSPVPDKNATSPKGSVPVVYGKDLKQFPVAEDLEEEGTGDPESISNILTLEERKTMTVEQKATWRAKQADLSNLRKDFHGVVTYTFDGIFSWQMYGSAEAVDENNSYTEYLMRCQWGTTFENMQPWIVAHRYREFVALDVALKKRFPGLEPNMPKLPKKEYFGRSLGSEVVAKRRASLETYMSKIISSMPTLLRSDLMNEFLHITDRIIAIKQKIVPTVTTPKGADGINQEMRRTSMGDLGNEVNGEEVKSDLEPTSKRQASEEIVQYWSIDEAENAKIEQQSKPLDEDELGTLELHIQQLGIILKDPAQAKESIKLGSNFRNLLRQVTPSWPRLRATAVVGVGVDFTLIPRALQAEEDLVRFISELRSLEAVHSFHR